MKQPVLFKDPYLSVQAYAGPTDGSVSTVSALLRSASYTILLDQAATEVLVGYLRVIRAYYNLDGRPKQQIQILYRQLVAQLANALQGSSRSTATVADITQLIQRLGCMHDWARQQQNAQLSYKST
ncbi:hypothetical protein [Pontibacter cellulosilyticus]|uniref:Uncharacterized protein n=1 Tax=Pontibacter cellulosilyticus TaxID=1720253 RepID=A0A923SHV1_9BACT|nr:hypothetical protein [Pontibacter cellulosilyticus]MBC5991942.1 hypothetical protein [Pontibacter cellulosilyticus]